MAAWKHGYCVIDRVVTPSWLQSREPVIHETSMEVAAVGVWNVTAVFMRKGHGMGGGLYNDAGLPEFHQAGTLRT
ncbi:hypothetical protein BN1708_006989 [Verticillium longisporum]|uniref:Uncharacterized protein n=1 Tax=Verticillium longisporum TaxID=100787 RepID=A0A0G4MPQ8_VERLO|nr:hypothetical protein BN1708_006989 [Verticillium longisporum]